MDDETRQVNVNYQNAEEAGYQFEKGRQKAQAEASQPQINYNYNNNSEPPKKKRRTWLWVLGWLFIFPVPLTILMLRKRDMKPAVKYCIIAVAWLVYFAIGMSGNAKKNSETTDTSKTETTAASEETSVENASAEYESDEVPV